MSYGFVAYLDESGDDGLKKVKPAHPTGSSEWFVLSAVVVRASNENAVGRWQKEILSDFGYTQRTDIHWNKLNPPRKRIVCEHIAQCPLRLFVFMSNKKNMQGYVNPRCFKEPYFFYWWCTRVLLERVTLFCSEASNVLYGTQKPIKFIFSQRGGMAYDRLTAYLRLLKFETEIGHVHNTTRNLIWSVIDLNQIYYAAHRNEAGVQLADAVAGAFYEAVNVDRIAPPDPQFAKMLIPRLYRRGPRRMIAEEGVKLMPAQRRARLLPIQREIFEAVGYPANRW
jgi:hypothetical protein